MIRLTLTMFVGVMWLEVADKPDAKPAVKFEIRRAEKEKAEGLTEAMVEGTKEKVYLHKTAELTNEDIADAQAAEDNSMMPAVSITLTRKGAEKMKKLTEGHLDKPIAILVDGKVISAPVVRSAVPGPKAMIAGRFTKEEAEKLAQAIKAK